MNIRTLLASVAMGAVLANAAQVRAQQEAPAVDEAGNSAGIADIIVTAQRREETLQRAAVAVSAISGDVLTQQSITQATDLSRLVPSLQIAPAAAFTQIYLRGVGTFGANAFAEQGVAFNLDGVYLSRPAAPSALFYDLERIEVLKGPQGTLYGRNASGGAVNLITAKPKIGETSGFINAEYGNYNAIKGSAAVNIPLGDKLAVRVAGQYVNRDGYFSDGYDDEDSIAFRGQVKLDPADGFDMTLMLDYGHVGGQGGGGTIMPLLDGKNRLGPSDPQVIAEYLKRTPTPPVPQIIATDEGFQDNDYFGAILTANADLGFATLTVIPAYRKTDLDFESFASSFLIDVQEKSEQISFEARLANQTDRLTWVLGGYYFAEDVLARQFFNQASNATRINSNLTTTSLAAFGQATFSLTDTFRATGGLRYTSDNKRQNTQSNSYPFVGFVPPGPPRFIPIILDIPTQANTDVDFDKLTWKAGVEFDVAERSLLYASVATGFKSGILYSAVGRNYSDPETMTAFTIGSKNRFMDNRLQLNVEGFYWKYRDQQISGLTPVQVASTPAGPIYGPVFATQNAGEATIWGVEVDLVWQLFEDGQFTVNAQYLNTNYNDLQFQSYSTTGAPPVSGCDVSPTSLVGTTPFARVYDVDCTGKPLPNAPEFAINLGYEHRFDIGDSGRIILGLDTRIETSRFLSLEFLELGQQGSYMMSNARLTWESASGTFAITGFINNIEDELVFSNSLQSPAKPGTVYNQLRPPRTYGIRAGVRF